MSTLTEMSVLFWFSLLLFLKAHNLTKAELSVPELYFQLMQLTEMRKVLVWTYSALVSVDTKPNWRNLTISLAQPGPRSVGTFSSAVIDAINYPSKEKHNRNNLVSFDPWPLKLKCVFFSLQWGKSCYPVIFVTVLLLWLLLLSDSHQQQPQPFRSLISLSRTHAATNTHE